MKKSFMTSEPELSLNMGFQGKVVVKDCTLMMTNDGSQLCPYIPCLTL